MGTDGRRLLSGVMIPVVTPMSEPGTPSAAAATALLQGLAAAGARGLMLFGSNGEGPLLPVSRLAGFAEQMARQWRELTGGPVLCNVTAAGTAEALERAAAVAPARPDALVLSPPIYFRHRDDEIAAHYAALADLGIPLVAYNAPRYSNPLGPAAIDRLVAMPHVVGIKDSSGDLDLLRHIVSAARSRPDFGVSQGRRTTCSRRCGSAPTASSRASPTWRPGSPSSSSRPTSPGGTPTRRTRSECSTGCSPCTPYGRECPRSRPCSTTAGCARRMWPRPSRRAPRPNGAT